MPPSLPEPVEYRREWRSYRIRLTFGTPAVETETEDVAAPEPPLGGYTGFSHADGRRDLVLGLRRATGADE